MSASIVHSTVTQVRSALQSPLLAQHEAAAAEHALRDLETRLQGQEPADWSYLAEQLRAWEASLEADHPVVAGLLSETVKKLLAMGV